MEHPGVDWDTDVIAPPEDGGGSGGASGSGSSGKDVLFPGDGGLTPDMEEANELEREFGWLQGPDPNSEDGRGSGDPESPSPPSPPTPASSGGETPPGGSAGGVAEDLRELSPAALLVADQLDELVTRLLQRRQEF